MTWDNVPSSCWSVGEICSGITCACLPTLRPLLSKFMPGMLSSEDSKGGSNNKKYYQRSSSGRDISHGNRSNKSADESASARGIIYPEDVELQSDDRSDKDIRVGVNRLEPQIPGRPKYGKAMDKLGLGLKPSVRTEIKVGSHASQQSWPGSDRGIEVKRDFNVMTSRGSRES